MTVYLSTLVPGVARAELDGAGWKVTRVLPEVDVRVLASDPRDSDLVWAGTQGGGVLRSVDAGANWSQAGLEGRIVKALAASPGGRIYAGTNPAALFVSEDDGSSWRELVGFRRVRRWFWFSPAERPFSAYVLGLALDGETVIAGIEAGAVVRSTDGGETWLPHRPGSLRDCHSLDDRPRPLLRGWRQRRRSGPSTCQPDRPVAEKESQVGKVFPDQRGAEFHLRVGGGGLDAQGTDGTEAATGTRRW